MSIFDRITARPQPADDEPDAGLPAGLPEADESAPRTGQRLREALQALLADGILEQERKPNLYRTAMLEQPALNVLLEPLDFEARVDEVRGLVFLQVRREEDGSLEDDWSHPLVRRQRLTLEQSLLLAILRREFLQREQDSGLGATVQLDVDSLLPQVEMYLGASGSDVQDRKRLTHLLDKLYEHGIVTRPDAQERITIRPLIVHLANPDNLQALLLHLQSLSNHSPESSGVVTSAQN